MSRFLIFSIAFVCLISTSAIARDTTHHFSIADAMERSDFKEALNPDVRFYFGKQAYPTPVSTGPEVVSNKKTKAFKRTDSEACEWVLLSALLSLQDRALREGANAVVDIVSYYKRKEFTSDTEYECHAGAIMAGLTLKGRVVTLP